MPVPSLKPFRLVFVLGLRQYELEHTQATVVALDLKDERVVRGERTQDAQGPSLDAFVHQRGQTGEPGVPLRAAAAGGPEELEGDAERHGQSPRSSRTTGANGSIAFSGRP